MTTFKMPVRDPNMPAAAGPDTLPTSSRWHLRPTGATSRSGTPGPTTTTACSTSRGESGSRPPCAAWTTRTFAEGLRPSFRIRCSARPLVASGGEAPPKTMRYTFVDTCFGTHHPQFGYDANDTLWLSGTGQVAGWVNTKMFDATGDAAQSQGWSRSSSIPTAMGSATSTSSQTSQSTRPRTSGLPQVQGPMP